MADAPLKLRNCNFKFRCTKTWQLLEVTGEAGVRFCEDCQKDVHLVKSRADLHECLKNDFCVAIPFDPHEEPWDDRANHLIGMIT
jgi:hypothetical protein